MQYEGRDNWYAAKFSADDAPDWNPATFLRSEDLAPGFRTVVLQCEISRERVPLRNAYKHANQRALVRVNGGAERSLAGEVLGSATSACLVQTRGLDAWPTEMASTLSSTLRAKFAVANPASSAPWPESLNKGSLFKTRGDIFAGETKVRVELGSVQAELELLVELKQAPEVYNASEGDLFELGPFKVGNIPIHHCRQINAGVRGPTGCSHTRTLARCTLQNVSDPKFANVKEPACHLACLD